MAEKKTVKMPDLSKLRYVYQRASSEQYDATDDSQLIATLKEGLSEEALKNPIVQAVLDAYAEKDEDKRKEALSQLNDMVQTEADLAIAQKIANEAQYDKPFDVPEIEHELLPPEPEKNIVKMPDLSNLRYVYQKGSSEKYDATDDLQLIATLKEGLSEEELKNPIVKAVLDAYAEKDEDKRKEALSQLNDMVQTEADLAIAQKIANEAQYDKPFDVPEIEHELLPPEPEKNMVKMPDLSNLRYVYQKGSSEQYDATDDSQLIATLKEGLSEEDLENPIVKAVLAAYAEKDAAKRKEALSKLNDMVQTEADLAIAQKIANEAQYDKPFDVPEIDHELSSPEPKVLAEKLPNGSIRTITEKDGFKLIETKRPDGSLDTKETIAPDGTKSTEYYEGGFLQGKLTETPDGTETSEWYNKDGSLSSKETETPDGTKTYESYRKDGSPYSKAIKTPDGTLTYDYYREDGSLRSKETKTPEGTWTYEDYREDGSLRRKLTETRDGTETSENYNEKGVKTSESLTDKEGNITTKGYDDEGNLSFTMVHNKEKGTYVQYDENGKLKKLVIKEPNGTTKVRTGLRAKLSALATGTSRRLPTKDRSDR